MLHLLVLPDLINKRRSLLLRPAALLSYICIVFFLLISSSAVVYSAPEVLGYATNINLKDLLKYTNLRREEAGLPYLKISAKLSKAAELKAKDMFENNYWAHISPTGKEPWSFIKEADYVYVYAGENLAIDFANSEGVVTAWYNSPSHKENLLSPNYIEVGFAVVNGELQGRKTTLIVQMFGYPKDALVQDGILQDDIVLGADAQTTDVVLNQEEFTRITDISSIQDSPTVNAITSVDIFLLSKFTAIILGSFLVIILAIDGFYAKISKTFRISGHTTLHIILLVLAMIGIWYTSIGLIQ